MIGRAPTVGCTQRPRVAADPAALVVVIQADQTQTGDVSLFDPERGLRRVMVLDQVGGG